MIILFNQHCLEVVLDNGAKIKGLVLSDNYDLKTATEVVREAFKDAKSIRDVEQYCRINNLYIHFQEITRK